MKKLLTLSVLLTLIFSTALNAQQTRIAVIPFTGGKDLEGDTIASLLSDDLVKVNRSKYRIAPRTSAINKVMEEQKFQRNGLTDADTIAELGKGANAQFVVTGHIRQLGGKKLIIVSITEVATFRQTAGDYHTYSDLAEIIDLLPNISKNLLTTTDKSNAAQNAPTLAMLPFEIAAGNSTSNTDAEVLTQILACELANTTKYTVITRTSTVEQIMKEHKIQRSGLTSSDNIEAIGKAINAQYVLSGYVRNLGSARLMAAQVMDVEELILQAGDRVQYKEMSDGLSLMAYLSTKLTGVASLTNVPTIADIIALCDKRAGQDYISYIKKLLQTGNIEAKANNGYTALMYASSAGYTEIAKALIAAKADVNAKDNYGQTALMAASICGHTEIAKALIAAKADVNAKNNDGWTALISASFSGYTETAKALIAAGASVNAAKNNDGWTALILASVYGYTEIAKALIAAGADVNAKDNYGWTALYWAEDREHTEIANYLKSVGGTK